MGWPRRSCSSALCSSPSFPLNLSARGCGKAPRISLVDALGRGGRLLVESGSLFIWLHSLLEVERNRRTAFAKNQGLLKRSRQLPTAGHRMSFKANFLRGDAVWKGGG